MHDKEHDDIIWYFLAHPLENDDEIFITALWQRFRINKNSLIGVLLWDYR